MLFRKKAEPSDPPPPPIPHGLPEFHPMTVLRDWEDYGQSFRIVDAQTGVAVFGATGSGKTSGPAKHLAHAYLAAEFGGLVLCAKKEERRQWQQWAAACGRSDDLIIVDQGGKCRFNFLDWEAKRAGEGGGLTINIVALLDEIAGAIGGAKGGGGGSSKFWDDALHHMNTNLVSLVVLSGVSLSLSQLRFVVNSAPQSSAQSADAEWRKTSECFFLVQQAETATAEADADTKAEFEECKSYWLHEFPNLAEKTRSIITLTFSMLTRPFLTRPLRTLFSTDTTVTPEDAFDGKIIIVDLPVQEFRLAGRVANLAWKYCFQVAVLRRTPPAQKDTFLRPVFLWADEAQNFVSEFDAEYQAVARSAGGCTVYLTQNRESYRRVLGNADAVDSLLGNLQCKFFCQNSGETNEWAAKLLGERWMSISGMNTTNPQNLAEENQRGGTAGVNISEQRRYFVEPAMFTTLKRGGEENAFEVEAVVYNGGKNFHGMPYAKLLFNQLR
jgi:hypothetical protein